MSTKTFLKQNLKQKKIHIVLRKKLSKTHSEFKILKMNCSTGMDHIQLNKTKLKKKNKRTSLMNTKEFYNSLPSNVKTKLINQPSLKLN